MVNPSSLVDVAVNGIDLKVPLIVVKLFDFIHQNVQQGIFRINGSTKKVNQYYSSLAKVDKWLPTADVYDVCSLLKRVLNKNYRFVDVAAVNLDTLIPNNNFSWAYMHEILVAQLDSTSLNLFVYVLNKLSGFIEYNDVTKMSVLNYSIIFQPILFACDNLIELPNYINLINYLLQNLVHLNVHELLSNPNVASSPIKATPVAAPPKIAESNLRYMFKNFKNKSIDSINETLRIKVPSHSVKPDSYTPVTVLFPSKTEVNHNYTFTEEVPDRDDQSCQSSESLDPLAPLSKALDQSIDRSSVVSQEGHVQAPANSSSRFNLMYDDLGSYISQSSLLSMKQNDVSYDTTVETSNDQELDIKPGELGVLDLSTDLKPPRLGVKTKGLLPKLNSTEVSSPISPLPTSPRFRTFKEKEALEGSRAKTPEETHSGKSSSSSILASSSPIMENVQSATPPSEVSTDNRSRRSSLVAALPQARLPRSGRSTDLSKRKSFIGLFKGDTSLVKRNFTLKLKSRSVY